MERVNQICRHPLWKARMEQIQRAEVHRIFCRHDFAHCLDVARLAYIENLERGLFVPRELIYAAALLHDTGRSMEDPGGIPHEQGSILLAKEILPGCGFDGEEERRILEAIGAHRNREAGLKDHLGGLLYRADKRSRNCMACKAAKECNWSSEKKNSRIWR